MGMLFFIGFVLTLEDPNTKFNILHAETNKYFTAKGGSIVLGNRPSSIKFSRENVGNSNKKVYKFKMGNRVKALDINRANNTLINWNIHRGANQQFVAKPTPSGDVNLIYNNLCITVVNPNLIKVQGCTPAKKIAQSFNVVPVGQPAPTDQPVVPPVPEKPDPGTKEDISDLKKKVADLNKKLNDVENRKMDRNQKVIVEDDEGPEYREHYENPIGKV